MVHIERFETRRVPQHVAVSKLAFLLEKTCISHRLNYLSVCPRQGNSDPSS